MIAIDTHARVTYINGTAAGLVDCRPDDATGRPVRDVLHLCDRDGFRLLDALRRRDANGAAPPSELRVLAVTAHAGIADERRVIEAGSTAICASPSTCANSRARSHASRGATADAPPASAAHRPPRRAGIAQVAGAARFCVLICASMCDAICVLRTRSPGLCCIACR
ncbi:PAS domain-containing protein [Burkholderia dolosa]|uniref:PAS domain-containing protein n=1 Tax=Burkholderia dolosa TaxID=152500 RepID=UPI0026571ECF|nr:PAS domain-containing protein [Burkholderia dolosa]MDN7421698.1 PAS domain-containing protein [Burkholderia dolosa]